MPCSCKIASKYSFTRSSVGRISGAYIDGGFIPLGPYIVLLKASAALIVSIAITLLALAIFGYVKGRFTGAPPLRSSIQTVFIGGVAAGVAFVIARAIS